MKRLFLKFPVFLDDIAQNLKSRFRVGYARNQRRHRPRIEDDGEIELFLRLAKLIERH